MEDLVHQSILFKTYLLLFSIGCSEVIVKGQLTLSPMSVAPVCSVGDPLHLTCTASVEAGIKWNIFRVDVNGIGDVLITVGSAKNQMIPMTVDSVMFTFIKNSAPGATPLVSTLSVDSVSIGLNGTIVNCSDLSDSMTSAATTIQIIDTSQNFFLYTPMLRVSDERYEVDNVIVTVEWTPQEGVTYTTSVSPLTSITVTGNSSRQLTISYNTNYNLSVEAAPPCRPNPTAVITLKYAKCNNPEMLFIYDMYNDTVPRIEDYDDMVPILEGRTVRFTCPPGFMLTGPDSAICAGSGEWEPDPRGIMCNNMTTTEDRVVTSQTSPNSVVIAASVAAVTVIIIVLLCIVVAVTVSVIVLHRKGNQKGLLLTEKKPHTESVPNKRFTAEYLDKNQGQQSHPEPDALIYADVIASKHRKRKKPQRTLRTAAHDETHDLDVQYSAINHDLTMCNDKKESHAPNDENIKLDVTLDTLLTLLRDQVGPKWREFGEAIDVDDMVLDSIANTTFSDNCIVELLDYWLKYYDGNPTWNDVAEALYNINLEKLAQKIEMGKFPSEGNTYVNVIGTLSAAKPSFQLPVMKTNDETDHSKQHCDSVISKSLKSPPPTATRPKSGINSDIPMQRLM